MTDFWNCRTFHQGENSMHGHRSRHCSEKCVRKGFNVRSSMTKRISRASQKTPTDDACYMFSFGGAFRIWQFDPPHNFTVDLSRRDPVRHRSSRTPFSGGLCVMYGARKSWRPSSIYAPPTQISFCRPCKSTELQFGPEVRPVAFYFGM
jgi:hypothetical protein